MKFRHQLRLVIVKPNQNRTQEVFQDLLTIAPEKTGETFQDTNWNSSYRFVFPQGKTTIEHDALVMRVQPRELAASAALSTKLSTKQVSDS